MQKSEQINELAAALSKAQAKIESATKSAKNPFFRSTYADLPAVWEACRKPLTDNGLSVVQVMDTSENGQILESILLHSSGQWISSLYPIRPTKDDPQGLGSATTYARRYSLMALVGIVADNEDDDGNAASGITAMTTTPSRAATSADEGLSRIQHFKKEGEERAREGRIALEQWWQSLLKSDQLKLKSYLDTFLKPMAVEADRESVESA